ncbi:MAG: aspartyl protease family protein [Nitrospirae bacterium]|nr:aspartyl protease family protein [Nitrospirota bacterium]
MEKNNSGQAGITTSYLCSKTTESKLKEAIMGLTVLEIEVGNPANPEITEKVEFLIDSGAIYSVVPTPILERLGIKPLAEQEFRLANGTKIVRKKGIALFKYGDKIGGADVIFGEEGDSQLLGAFTLEALGLSLDPLKRELRPLPMILAGF